MFHPNLLRSTGNGWGVFYVPGQSAGQAAFHARSVDDLLGGEPFFSTRQLSDMIPRIQV
jgi:hypothetical protein